MFARNLPAGAACSKGPRRSHRFGPKRRAEGGSERVAALYRGDVDFSLVAASAGLKFQAWQEPSARSAFRRLQELAAGALAEDESESGGDGSLLEFSVRTANGPFRERINMHETPAGLQRLLARIALRSLQPGSEHGGGFEEATAIVCRSSRVATFASDPPQVLPEPREEKSVDGSSGPSAPELDTRRCSVSFAGCDENIYFKDECAVLDSAARNISFEDFTEWRTSFGIASVVVDDPRLSLFEEGDQPQGSQLLMWTPHNAF